MAKNAKFGNLRKYNERPRMILILTKSVDCDYSLFFVIKIFQLQPDRIAARAMNSQFTVKVKTMQTNAKSERTTTFMFGLLFMLFRMFGRLKRFIIFEDILFYGLSCEKGKTEVADAETEEHVFCDALLEVQEV
jgi:hypothetical protein